jgi:SAM-dependent methyltransferase
MNQKTQQFNLSGVAAEVKDFYDRYPYPRPVENLDTYRVQWQDPQRRRADYHLFWPDKPFREDLSILIAGCGTSQAAKYALRWPAAQVTGIDVSETSVLHTEQLKQKYHLENLDIRQLPIERVGEIGEKFDYIVSTGVLHHLADPDMGFRALRDVLKLEGAMHLMVYARYGRTGIYMMQEFCRRVGIHASDAEISDLVAAIKELPPGHPLEYLLRVARDFKDPAELADALLHPKDCAYSVPQLFEVLKKIGLVFSRWIRQAPYNPNCGIIANLPQYPGLSKLPVEEQYAAVELFRGTMVRHSFVAYRDDRPDPWQIGFSGDAWTGYVPIRLPDTIYVQERLPPGASAVLINRNHTYTDIYLPINSDEKKLFDAVDNEHSIKEIINKISTGFDRQPSLETARAFFEKLWLYDQVVFDTSQ